VHGERWPSRAGRILSLTIKKRSETLIETDVLVVGGGGAGLMAALEARQKGCRVTLVDKGIPSKSCATLMAKQLASAGPWSYPHDSPEKHLQDTLASGCFINNRALVQTFVTQAASTIDTLERMGMLFEREPSGEGFLPGGQLAGHSYPRSLGYKETTGKMIVDALRREAMRRGVLLVPDTLVTRLLVEDGQVRGVVGWNIARGEIDLIQSKALILATGGCGQLYPVTSNPEQATGEGYILGFEAGAELIDLEMFQFYPVSMVHPKFLRGLNLNFRGRLLNARMERFMEKADPVNLENVTRDKLSQGIYQQIKKGLSAPHGGVYLGASDFDPEVYRKRFPTEYRYCLEAGIDLEKDLVEVAPAAHFMMGGIKIDPDCQTRIRGLFAAGEVTGGLHGANRLANNALMEIFVFGKIAGKSAGAFALEENGKTPTHRFAEQATHEIELLFQPKKEGIRGWEVKRVLRELMWEKVGVIRETSQLNEAVGKLQEWKESLLPRLAVNLSHTKFNYDIVDAIEAAAMAKLGLLMAQSASMRRESRGAHALEGYPQQADQQYLKNIAVRKKTGGETEFRMISVTGAS
jgi:fumarate reductase (CoM/CoB) subunit A